MGKKILIVGNGAREYALAKKFSEEHEIFVAPGNDTMKEFATIVDIRPNKINELLDFALENNIDMTVPLAQEAIQNDIAARFTENKQCIFAPTANANIISANKILSKKILYKLRIPTPKFGIFEKANLALDYIKNQKIPFVCKTNDSNSAVIFTSASTAKNYVETVFTEKNKKIIIEDYVYGTPFSYYAITDGYKALPLGSSLTYKHSLDGNGGQLTSGTGACSPNYKLSYDNEYFLMDNVIYPTLEYLERDSNPYMGIMGVNGILTDDGEIVVLGWQTFMQDCDCAAVLNSLDEDLYSLFYSCIIGSFSDEVENIRCNNLYSVSVVLSCANRQNSDNAIEGLDNIDDGTIITFYPSVTKNKYLEYNVQNGMSLMVTSSSSSVAKAAQKTYSELKELSFRGMQYRKDICLMHA